MTEYIDLNFRGSDRVIATAVLLGPDGVTLVDPGPTSCLPVLEAGLRQRGLTLRDVRALVLTHIHLDHAGAVGTIVERVPSIRVHVHERGAPHMVDPAKLLASATRLYGDQMDALWGAFLPVPAANVNVLQGGERIATAGTTLQVAYTPGHAKHHVSYLDETTGVAYVGDTGGIRVSADYLIAPTPPPDIDLAAWRDSLTTIDTWQPVSLFLTHFGVVSGAKAHLARFRETLTAQAEAVRLSLTAGSTDEERTRVFVEQMRREVRKAMSEHEARATELVAPFDQLWQGLDRYWKKQITKNE
ncbi:MAG: MBL fold metallo-hydrolase [Acidobacteria bacterium]|nr:MBL fold metallo-hydrolase [Acidobacteriota bacterium]MSO84233.1 MBL fold metallo-hydrolase [Acidobacteriota bacterium]